MDAYVNDRGCKKKEKIKAISDTLDTLQSLFCPLSYIYYAIHCLISVVSFAWIVSFNLSVM
jgi:hypothetical protein